MGHGNSWVLAGGRVARNAMRADLLDIEIRAGRIAGLRRPGERIRSVPRVDVRGCVILPGLINAHDHLEFNLFPRLGRGPYPDARAWARDIYHPKQSPVRDHLRVPPPVRLRWGGIKNLLSGVTTVCHHNPYEARVFEREFPVRVAKHFGWAHSLEWSPDLAERFRATPIDWPFVLHLAESKNRDGARQVFQLDAKGALDQRTVLVHGVGLKDGGLRLALERGASVVWCPSSNLFILGKTLRREVFESGIPIALGSDSALSAGGDLLDELRVARATGLASTARLYRMVTSDAARVMRLQDGAGSIEEGALANLTVVKQETTAPAATLMRLRTGAMDLVLVRGRVHLVSPCMAAQMPVSDRRRLYPLVVGEDRTVFVRANIPRLFREASRRLGPGFLLAGKRIRLG